MAKPEHLDILKQGVNVWNTWREEQPRVWPDLGKANLVMANLQGAHLQGANLKGANLAAADLDDARLDMANLRETNLRRASLLRANLVMANLALASLLEANLQGANLEKADLIRTNLTRANLAKTLLRDTRLVDTFFTDTNLSDALGLDQCSHIGPSTIDHRTLALNPHLPDRFLRGCGLSNWQIEAAKLYRRDLTVSQITDISYRIVELRTDPALKFHSCFISHSSEDAEFTRQLYKDLQASGVRCWFAPEDLKTGDRIRHAIDDAIHLHDKLLLILSRDALDSGWVQYEADRALSQELIDKRIILFPIRIDDSVYALKEGWALHIKEDRHIGDFSQWNNPEKYHSAFRRLLRDLQASV